MKREVAGFKERCEALEKEILIVKGNDMAPRSQDNAMEFEMRKLRDTYSKQISALKEEKSSLAVQLQTAQNKLKAQSEENLKGMFEQQLSEKESQIELLEGQSTEIKVLVGCTSHDEIIETLKKIIVQNEESRLLQDEYQALQESYTQITTQLKALENDKIKMTKEIKEKDLLINAAPSNFTKNLLA